jgi:peptide-methionine (S)-S-oxide reductase
MFSFRKKAVMPDVAAIFPGRSTPIAVPERHVLSGNRLAPPFPEGLKLALFGLGCFWGAERKFWQLPGVYSTSVGYAAGATPNPTYEEVCSGYTGRGAGVLLCGGLSPAVSGEESEWVLWDWWMRSHVGCSTRSSR